jgi:hypothetical protein
MLPIVAKLQDLVPKLKVIEVPSFDALLSTEAAHFPYEKSYAEAENEPILKLHSSGSTGMFFYYTQGAITE